MRPEHASIGPAPSLTRRSSELRIEADGVVLDGELTPPSDDHGIVVFVHGSGSSRHSPRDRAVASALRTLGLGTLQFDLRTAEEESLDRLVGWLNFDAEALANRLIAVTRWLQRQPGMAGRRIGYFGAGSGAAAAVIAASRLPGEINALVSRGGRLDLADNALGQLQAATLMLVGDRDSPTMALNRTALPKLACDKELVVIAGASHLFGEPGTLEQVATLSATWFRGFLAGDLSRH